MKKLLSLGLTFLLAFTLCTTAAAQEDIYTAYGRDLVLNPGESLNGQYAGQKLIVYCCTGEFAAPLQESAAEFSKLSGCEVEIVIYPWAELVSKISLALNGDEEMDAFCFVSAFMKTYSTLDQLADLTALSQAYGAEDYNWDGFIPELLARTADDDGNVFAIPYQMCEMMMFYRKDLLPEGTVLPNTVEEIKELAAAYTKSLNPDSPTTFGFLSMYEAETAQWTWMSRLGYYGGALVDSDWNILLDQNDAAVQAMNAAMDMLAYEPSNYVEYGFDDVNTMLSQGEAFMGEIWSSAAPFIDTAYASGKIGYAVTTGSSPTISGWSLGINALSDKQELAWKFLEFCSTEDDEMTKVDDGLPPARSANYDYLIGIGETPEFYQALLESLNCQGATWGDVCLPYLGTQGNVILADWTMKAYTGSITPEEAVAGIVSDLKAALASVGIEK